MCRDFVFVRFHLLALNRVRFPAKQSRAVSVSRKPESKQARSIGGLV